MFFFFFLCGWDAGGVRGVSLDIYLSVVVWFSWVSDYLICFLSWLWMKVMFSRKIGSDGSVTMVVIDHIWVHL